MNYILKSISNKRRHMDSTRTSQLDCHNYVDKVHITYNSREDTKKQQGYF